MEPDDRSPDEAATEERFDAGPARRARLRVALVAVTLVAVLALIAIGVVRIVQA